MTTPALSSRLSSIRASAKRHPERTIAIVVASVLAIVGVVLLVVFRKDIFGEKKAVKGGGRALPAAAQEMPEPAGDDGKDNEEDEEIVGGGSEEDALEKADKRDGKQLSIGRGATAFDASAMVGSGRDMLTESERTGKRLSRFIRKSTRADDGSSLRERMATTDMEKDRARKISNRSDPARIKQQFRRRREAMRNMKAPMSGALQSLVGNLGSRPDRLEKIRAMAKRLIAKRDAGEPLPSGFSEKPEMMELLDAVESGQPLF